MDSPAPDRSDDTPPKPRSALASAVRQPIVHFLAAGALLFGAFQMINPSDPNTGSHIVVDRDTLLTFMQYRTNAFEFDLFNKQLDDLSPSERRALVDDFIREEVLYREALAMGLEQGDYIIRQRMVQKLQFLIEGSVGESIVPTESELEEFYKLFEADYAEPPVYTFTHVFFDREQRGDAGAREAAEQARIDLNRRHVGFSSATEWGDRPLYYQNYVDRTRDFVSGHLGEALTRELDDAEPSDTVWIGPFESPYGWHVVLLTQKSPARVPDLAELAGRVREDYERIALDRARRASIDQLIGEYDVEIRGIDLDDTGRGDE